MNMVLILDKGDILTAVIFIIAIVLLYFVMTEGDRFDGFKDIIALLFILAFVIIPLIAILSWM